MDCSFEQNEKQNRNNSTATSKSFEYSPIQSNLQTSHFQFECIINCMLNTHKGM